MTSQSKNNLWMTARCKCTNSGWWTHSCYSNICVGIGRVRSGNNCSDQIEDGKNEAVDKFLESDETK